MANDGRALEWEVSAAIVVGCGEGDDETLADAKEMISGECWVGLVEYVKRLKAALASAIEERDAAKRTYDTNLATLKRNNEIAASEWEQEIRGVASERDAAIERAEVAERALRMSISSDWYGLGTQDQVEAALLQMLTDTRQQLAAERQGNG